MTRNPPLPQGLQKLVESTEKVCAHVANPCFRDKTLEDMIARKSCPLQRDTSAEMASFWPTLKRFKNVGLDACGRLSGRHVGPFILAWPEAVNGSTTQSLKRIINRPSKQTPICGWKIENKIREVCWFVTAHLQCKYQKLQLHLHLVASPVSFISSQPQTQTRASKLLDGTESIREMLKFWAVMGISFTVQCCRSAAFYIVKPVFQSPMFKKNERS